MVDDYTTFLSFYLIPYLPVKAGRGMFALCIIPMEVLISSNALVVNHYTNSLCANDCALTCYEY